MDTAKNTDLPDLLEHLGYRLHRIGRYYTTREMDSIRVKDRRIWKRYRKHKTLDSCPQLSVEEIEKLKTEMAHSWRAQPKPYESYALTNNNASIRQVKARIEELTQRAETVYEGWKFDGGEVKADRETNRLQVFFDEKPDRETCSAMRHGGFRWAPSVGAWQRQLNDNAIRAAKHIDCLRPVAEETPTQIQVQAEPVPEPPKPDAALERIAAQYHSFLQECYPLPRDADIRAAQINEVIQFLRWKGKTGAGQLSLAVASFAAELSDNPTVQNLASELMKELAQYNEPGWASVQQQKPQRRKSQER